MSAILYTDIQAPLDFEGMTKEEYLKIIEENDLGQDIEFEGMTAEDIFQHYLKIEFIVEK